MPVPAVKPAPEDMVAEGGGEGERLPSLKVPKELLRSFLHSKRVGSYLVGKMINKGSFAKVMEGLHIGTGEKVAIKVIDKKKARQDSYVLKNMKREPRIHQMVRHPHIVVLLETLETENSYYMAMELCAGGDLMDRICDRKRLEEKEVRRYTRQILTAVEHLHKHGIVHRDLKIENFLLDDHNNIKIVDFGLSNTLKAESLSAELLNTQCGSPAYAAPELLAHRKYGPKVDVWSIDDSLKVRGLENLDQQSVALFMGTPTVVRRIEVSPGSPWWSAQGSSNGEPYLTVTSNMLSGVSMFAMLTGTLPFTVEPFNIKQLHQKMLNGEISSIPSDISKGAVAFVLSLLEPDPAKRPTVSTAMEDRWINEGYAKKPLHSISHSNRLCAEELNSSVLAYMTESLGYSRSDIIHTLTNNRPSAITASYHLLLQKLGRSNKAAKAAKKLDSSEWSFPGSNTVKDESSTESNPQQQGDTAHSVPLRNNHFQSTNEKRCKQPHASECQSRKRRDVLLRQERCEDHQNRPPSPSLPQLPHSTSPTVPPCLPCLSPAPLSPEEGTTEEDIAIALDTRAPPFPEVSVSGDGELVHLSPPKSSASQLCDSALCQAPIPAEPSRHRIQLRTTPLDCFHGNHLQDDNSHQLSTNEGPEKLQTFYTSEKTGVSPKIVLDPDAHMVHSSDCGHSGAMETAQTSPSAHLPRLRNVGLKDRQSRKMTWVGLACPEPPGLLVTRSKPPAFPSQRQHTLLMKSLRQDRGKRRELAASGGERGKAGGLMGGAKRNPVQFRSSDQRRVADLNLPLLPAALQGKAERKKQLPNMEY